MTTGAEQPVTRVAIRDVVVDAVRFENERSKVPVPFRGTVLDLVGRVHVARAVKKGTLAWSGVRYRAGATRGKRGIVEATLVGLDFDHVTTEAAEAIWRRLKAAGWAFVAYSSFSHLAGGADDCCFRVVVLLSRAARPEEFDAVWDAVNAALGGLADANARDISRIWYVAACPPERMEQAWVRVGDGLLVDVDAILASRGPSSCRARRRSRRHRGDDGGPIAQGDRNTALFSLAGVVRRRGAGVDEVLQFLRATNSARCRPPLPDEELVALAESVCRYDPASVLLAANRTDLGNAERFVAFAGDRFRYCHAWGCWFHYDGARWRRDGDGEAVRAARDTLRAVAAEAESIPDEEHRSELVAHALESESSARISAMLTLAQSLLPIAPEALDAHPDLLNVANGTLDLRTGVLRPHDREDYLTRIVEVAYDPEATCPLWEAFLQRIMGGNARLMRFLQLAVGYSLTGHTSEQVLLLLYGTGANGKSTFLETLRALLGDLAAVADFTTFLKRDNEGVRNDLARLVGIRLVSAVEAESGRPLAEALVKQLTGGDTITARFLFREFFDFKPQFKIWLAANHKPAVSGSDHGIWRRIRLVPFTVTIPDDEQDKKLPQRLAAELPGILAWAVRGCMEWRANGLGVPDEVRAATASYREEMDVFGAFFEERCFFAAGAVVASKDLNDAYAAWCEANGERARTAKALATALRERGLETGRLAKGVRCWRGVRLRREDDPSPGAGDGLRIGDGSGGNLAVDRDLAHRACAGSENAADHPKDPGAASPSATRHPGATRHLPGDDTEEGEI